MKILFWLIFTTVVFAAESKLSETNQLKADNHLLKLRLLQQSCQNEANQLQSEGIQLINEFKKELKPAEGLKFDWAKKEFVEDK